jgi:hypothetical protein
MPHGIRRRKELGSGIKRGDGSHGPKKKKGGGAEDKGRKGLEIRE